jgi:hypothetical protein
MWGLDPGCQPLMSCRRGGGRGRHGQSRPPPPRSLRPPAVAARDSTAATHVAAVLEAAHRQSDLRGRPLPSRETRPPPRRGRRGQSRLPRHGCWCAAWWGRERGAATALVLIVVAVPITLVNDHLLLLEHGPLWVGDGSHGGTTAVATTGTTGTTSRCAPRRSCPRPYRTIALSHASLAVVPQLLEEEREREKRG